MTPASLQLLPAPLRDEEFVFFKHGVFDDPGIDVHVNRAGDFAYLAPPPSVDYASYRPRHAALGLGAYRKTQRVAESRHARIGQHLRGAASVLEVGAADGAFLAELRKADPAVLLAAIEPDATTREAREAIPGLRQFASIDAAASAGLRAEVVCLFHVFEHFPDPGAWLASVRGVLAPGGRLVIEVPSLDDPLLSLYQSSPYRDFYFQRQHPYVYSAASLSRVLEFHGFGAELIPYQRYGIENHMTWLTTGKPGGSAELGRLLGSCDAAYRSALEASGRTDAVFAVARAKP